MPKTTVEIRTDENGYFSRTLPLGQLGSLGATPCLTLTLLSPFATGVWGSASIDATDDEPAHERRAFVAWHSETVPLGSWRLDCRDYIIVLTGKTKPLRPHARLVLEIDVTW